jgi:hypothetical protein
MHPYIYTKPVVEINNTLKLKPDLSLLFAGKITWDVFGLLHDAQSLLSFLK